MNIKLYRQVFMSPMVYFSYFCFIEVFQYPLSVLINYFNLAGSLFFYYCFTSFIVSCLEKG